MAILALIAVEDTASMRVVPIAGDGRVEDLLEKSSSPAPTHPINAGAYVLEREVVEATAAGRGVSIESEIFPGLVGAGLYGYLAEGYWMDIGTPERYLKATRDLPTVPHEPFVPASSRFALLRGCRTDGAVQPQGGGCSVSAGSSMDRSVLDRAVTVGRDPVAEESVLAEGVTVLDSARLGAGAPVGNGALIVPGSHIEPGARIAPGALVA